jgi:hypothetical protein
VSFCLVWAADGAVPVAVVEAVIAWLDAGRPKPDRAAATIGAMVAGSSTPLRRAGRGRRAEPDVAGPPDARAAALGRAARRWPAEPGHGGHRAGSALVVRELIGDPGADRAVTGLLVVMGMWMARRCAYVQDACEHWPER